ncbi:MAG: peptidoglycan DD-metalloendopeptidase family protein [Firmicutes bacterium]|nr:peptidoglycan DD-metalloendopeptidase family protein [Bacillota bacterium]MDD3297534.1 peptidoglycan DD-metalloendopeptidase family protein [Bacillota bacterium]MDD3850218.1 peptidoglycan DD-metalloendopeptidase family protein [Bacillota bacterium]MDD4707239.1 peptidoglycan DD-metalloendopeptidase family protein [Bacillota bacterium]
MRNSRLVSIIVAASIVLLHSTAVYANLAEEQTKLEQVQQEQQNKQSQLKDVQQQKNSLIKELERLNNQLNEAENQLGRVERDIDATRKELERVTKELEEAQKELEKRDDLYKQRLRTMYKNSGYGYLEVLLNAESFSDFISRFYLVSKVAAYDISILEELKECRNLVQAKQDEVKEKEVRMLSLRNDLRKKREEIKTVTASRNNALSRVKNEEKELDKMLAELEKTSRQITATILSLAQNGEFIGGKFVWPAPGYTYITSDYGWRLHPIYKTRKYHAGIDIRVPWGKKIVAAGAGKIIYSGTYGGYGKTVMIDHGGGIVTLYAHNSSLKVKVGTVVAAGTTISLAGSTGVSTGPHLHFEVRKDGKVVNPRPWLGI